MSGRKCIYKAKQAQEDEEDFFLPVCLEIGPDVQLREIPTTGQEYLLKVQTERKNYAAVSKCNVDYSHLAQNQSYFVEHITCAAAPEKLKPTIEWIKIQVADFSDIRMYISRVKSKKHLWPRDFKPINIIHNDFGSWHRFFSTTEPTLTTIFGLPNVALDRALQVLIESIDNSAKTIDHDKGRWIYAVLACIRHPLLSITVSILRDLARKCALIRCNIDENDENAEQLAVPMNLFISLVGQYFGQYDLADYYELVIN